MSEIERATRGEVIEVGLADIEPRKHCEGHPTGDDRNQPPITWIGLQWDESERDEGETAFRPPPAMPPVRMGWSLVIATVSNLVLATVAIATGATLIGLVACSTLSLATCLLVLAELIGRSGR